MRLLNTYTGEFCEFPDHSQAPRYAILSHTWSLAGEQTYQDVRKIQEAFIAATDRTSHQINAPPRLAGVKPHYASKSIPGDDVVPAGLVPPAPEGCMNQKPMEGTSSLLFTWNWLIR